MMTQYHIGSLDEEGKAALSGEEVAPDPNAAPSPTFLAPRTWKKATLHSKTTISWDTRVFRFKLEHESQTLGLPTGQHLMMRLRDPVTREAIIRSYTPTSAPQQAGYVDVLVKVYFASGAREGGKMSMALDALPIGHFVDFKGPIGKFTYHGAGECSVQGVRRSVKHFVMICGGSGVTPVYQVLRAVMLDKKDPTRCTVLDGNRLVEDILCKEEMDGFARDNGERCRLLYTLTQAPENWQGLKGRIAAPLLAEHASKDVLGVADGEAMVLICGPEALEKSCHKALLELGWKDDELLFF